MIIEAPGEENWTQKNTVENMKHFKIQLLFNNPKNTAAVISTQKIQILQIQNQKNTPLIPVCKYAKSNPWDPEMIGYFAS